MIILKRHKVGAMTATYHASCRPPERNPRMYKSRATGLPDGGHGTHGQAVIDGNGGTVGPTTNEFAEYEDILNSGIGVSLYCEGQISIPKDMINFFADFTRKFLKHFADLVAAKREAGSTYAENLRGRAPLSLEKSGGLPGVVW